MDRSKKYKRYIFAGICWATVILLLVGCGADTVPANLTVSSAGPSVSDQSSNPADSASSPTDGGQNGGGTSSSQSEQPPLERIERNDAYFDGALFVGDSIIEGLRQYVATQRKETPTLGESEFLTSIMGITLADLVGDNTPRIYYSYQGKEAPLEDLITAIAPRRVFLLLGLNDLSAADPSVEETVERYGRLIDNVKATLPEVEVIVLTNPPKVASSWLPAYTANRNFNNELIKEFVTALADMCDERGIPWIDIHSCLMDEAGALPDDYCRDGYLHLSNTGAQVVVEALYDFAADKR